jgi:hypothetical protein
MSRKRQKKYLKPSFFDPKGHWMVGIVWSIKGSKGNDYNVELTDGGFDCDCPGFGYHGYCKHSRAIVKQIEEAFDGRYPKFKTV